MEEDAASPNPSADSAEGCFSCGVLTHTTDQCQTLGERGWSPGSVMTTDPQLPVVGEDIPGPAVPCHVGTARLLETVNNRTGSVGRAVRRPYSDSDESDNDVLYAEEHDSTVRQVSLRNEWLTQTADDSCG